MFLMTRNCAKFRIFSIVHYDTFFLRKKNMYKPYQKLIQFFYREDTSNLKTVSPGCVHVKVLTILKCVNLVLQLLLIIVQNYNVCLINFSTNKTLTCKT